MTSSSVLVLSVSSPVVVSCRLAVWTGVTSAEVLVSESPLKGLCRNVGLRGVGGPLTASVPAPAPIGTVTTVWGSEVVERGQLAGSVRSPSGRRGTGDRFRLKHTPYTGLAPDQGQMHSCFRSKYFNALLSSSGV